MSKNLTIELLIDLFLWYIIVLLLSLFFAIYILSRYFKEIVGYSIYGLAHLIPSFFVWLIMVSVFRYTILFFVKHRLVNPKTARNFVDLFCVSYGIYWLCHFVLLYFGYIQK